MSHASQDQHDTASIGAILLAAAVVAASGAYMQPTSSEPSAQATVTAATTSGAANGAVSTASILPPPAATVTSTRVTATESPTAAVRASASVTATTAATVTVHTPPVTSAAVPVDAPAPYFTFRRPFSPEHAVEPSRYYPYGTDGRGEYLLHHGVDIGNAMGTPVVAVGEGEVVYAGNDTDRLWGPQPNFYGNVVVIRHIPTVDGQPLYSLYGHLSVVKAKAGDAVKAGDVIGLVGMAGIALGPHLHLEFRVGDPNYEATRNTELFLSFLPGRGTIIGRVKNAAGGLAPTVRVTLFRRGAGGKATYVGETTTYPGRHVNPSTEWGENFLFGDIPAGDYTLSAQSAHGPMSVPVTVVDGKAVVVELGP